jgi:adenylosuccinate lyase
MPNKYNPWRLEGGVAYIKKGMEMLDATWQQLVDYNHEGDMARSIIMRDVGDDFSKIIIGIERVLDELKQYEPNYIKIKEFLDQNPGLVGGAAQTILKRAKVEGDPYRLIQQVSIRTDGSYVTRQEFEDGLRKLIDEKKIPNEVGTEILYRADPANNVGYAHDLAKKTIIEAKLTIKRLKELYN